MIYAKNIDELICKESAITENLESTYAIVWGKCSDVMRQRVEASPDYAVFLAENDVISLLETVKNIS